MRSFCKVLAPEGLSPSSVPTMPEVPSTHDSVNLTTQLPSMLNHLELGKQILQRRRTVIATADRVLITGLVSVCGEIGPLVGAATSEAEALTCLQSGAVDLLICTDMLDSGTGPSLVQRAKEVHPALVCLMLIQRPLRSTIEAAIQAGCNGLCSRERVGNGHLLGAIQTIESDGMVVDPTIAGVLRHSRLKRTSQPDLLSDELSVREEDVLRGICRGLTNQEIADQLHLSMDRVKHLVSGLLIKLGARDRTQALLIALQNDLIDLPAQLPRWTS